MKAKFLSFILGTVLFIGAAIADDGDVWFQRVSKDAVLRALVMTEDVVQQLDVDVFLREIKANQPLTFRGLALACKAASTASDCEQGCRKLVLAAMDGQNQLLKNKQHTTSNESAATAGRPYINLTSQTFLDHKEELCHTLAASYLDDLRSKDGSWRNRIKAPTAKKLKSIEYDPNTNTCIQIYTDSETKYGIFVCARLTNVSNLRATNNSIDANVSSSKWHKGYTFTDEDAFITQHSIVDCQDTVKTESAAVQEKKTTSAAPVSQDPAQELKTKLETVANNLAASEMKDLPYKKVGDDCDVSKKQCVFSYSTQKTAVFMCCNVTSNNEPRCYRDGMLTPKLGDGVDIQELVEQYGKISKPGCLFF